MKSREWLVVLRFTDNRIVYVQGERQRIDLQLANAKLFKDFVGYDLYSLVTSGGK